MQYAAPKKAGVLVSVETTTKRSHKKSKKEPTVLDEHGNVSIDAQVRKRTFFYNDTELSSRFRVLDIMKFLKEAHSLYYHSSSFEIIAQRLP